MSENLKPRQSAVRILARVLFDEHTVDSAIALENDFADYTDSDRNFIRLLILTTLRRLGQIDKVLEKVLKRPLPHKQATVLNILRLSIAQKIFLKTPDYAVVNTAVALTKKFHFNGLSGLTNAVLRNISRLKDPLADLQNPFLNLPDWLQQSWIKAYGTETASKIAEAILTPPPLDITVHGDKTFWADKWQGTILPTDSIRVAVTSPEQLDGFIDGPCWVQNAAASVPAQLLSDLTGKVVADLCAAPGGKTAQLAFRGGQVTAFDISEKRLKTLHRNIERLGLSGSVQTIQTDLLTLPAQVQFDATLLDAPCSATGTLARHPEIKFHRTAEDIKRLSDLQKQLLAKAIALTKQGGEIVFSTCSLQPEEGDTVIQSVLDQVEIIRPTDSRWQPYLTTFGSLRFLPSDGFDGFYACLLRKR